MLTFGWGAESVLDGFSSLSKLYLIRAKWHGNRILCAVTEEVLEDVLRVKLPADQDVLSPELTKRLQAKFLTIATEVRLLPSIRTILLPGFLLTTLDF